MRRRDVTGMVALLGLATSCNALTDANGAALILAIGEPTVEFDPAPFLTAGANAVICADLPVAMKSYVVTFTDYGPEYNDSDGFPITLASSPPTPCSQPVRFVGGTTGHRYVADVDGYEE